MEQEQEQDAFGDLTTCAIADSARFGLCRSGVGRVDSGEGFLQPQRVRVAGLRDRMVLLTQTSLDEAVSTQRLVLIDEKLQQVHQVPIGKGRPSVSHAHYDPATKLLLLALSRSDDYETVGIALDTGTERFRIKH